MERKPAIRATMYFSYGRNARPGMKARTTFDAILAGERTSTTRFIVWPGTDRYRRLQPGDLVEFFEDREMKGRSVVVEVTERREVDMARFTEAELEAWSRAEGWSVEAARGFAAKYGKGVQILYRQAAPLVTPVISEPAQQSLKL